MTTNLSVVQIERLLAAYSSFRETEQQAEEIKGTWSELKKQLAEREEALLQGIEALREKYGEGERSVPPREQRVIFDLQKDFGRTRDKFNLKDREKRRIEDLAKKLGERVFAILDEAKEGPDLYSKDTDNALAWREIQIADLVESGLSSTFRLHEVHNIGDFLKAWTQGDLTRLKKEIDPKLAGFVGAKIAAVLRARGLEKEIPKDMRELSASLKNVPDVKPEEPPAAPAPEPAPDAPAGLFTATDAWPRSYQFFDGAGAAVDGVVSYATQEALFSAAQELETKLKVKAQYQNQQADAGFKWYGRGAKILIHAKRVPTPAELKAAAKAKPDPDAEPARGEAPEEKTEKKEKTKRQKMLQKYASRVRKGA